MTGSSVMYYVHVVHMVLQVSIHLMIMSVQPV